MQQVRPGASIAWLVGGRNKFWEGTKSLFILIWGSTRSLSSVDQMKKVKRKIKVFSTKVSTISGCLKILAIFHEFLSEDQTKKKRSSSQNFYEIRCESTKITKKRFLLANSRAVNTNLGVLGLDLHSSIPEPVNFFGAQSYLAQFSFKGAQAVIWGARPRNAPRGAGPAIKVVLLACIWCRFWLLRTTAAGLMLSRTQDELH